MRAYVRDAIIEPAIGRDVRSRRLRRPSAPSSLRYCRRLARANCLAAKAAGQLQTATIETVANYLALLGDAI